MIIYFMLVFFIFYIFEAFNYIVVSLQWIIFIVKVKSRNHPVIHKKQYLVGDVHKCLQQHRQKDAYCALGINWTDYYPQENLNFVLGEASGSFRVGAFCFGRYEPRAYVDGQPPPEITSLDGELLWKMMKVPVMIIINYRKYIWSFILCLSFLYFIYLKLSITLL